MTRWSDDRLGLGLVGVPLSCTLLAAIGLAARTDLGIITFWGATLFGMLVTYVLAGMDASRRGQTASILILMAWGIGYPLHMRTRQRYPGTYFGLGSGLLVLAFWLVGIYTAVHIASVRARGI